jgi:hypothetical protein
MNFFDHKDLGNHLLQLCPKVAKHSVCVCVCVYIYIYIISERCHGPRSALHAPRWSLCYTGLLSVKRISPKITTNSKSGDWCTVWVSGDVHCQIQQYRSGTRCCHYYSRTSRIFYTELHRSCNPWLFPS